MMDYGVAPLRVDQIERALVLVRAVAPNFSADLWQALARSRPQWQTMAVSDLAGYIRGVALFTIGRHPVCRCLIDVPLFVVGSAVNEHEIAARLFDSLKRSALTHGCEYMRIWGSPPETFLGFNRSVPYERWDHGLMHPL